MSKMKADWQPPRRLALSPPVFNVYIDGYNLYSGINHAAPPNLLRLGWSNYQKLGELLVGLSFKHISEAREVKVKYFTATVDNKRSKRGEIERQQLWLAALQEDAPEVVVIQGIHAGRSGDPSRRQEKMTDVNIAMHITRDLLQAKPSGIVLVSGDRDFVPAVELALSVNIPVAIFIPQDHGPYELSEDPAVSDRVAVSYLTQAIMNNCRLSDRHWIKYLQLKVRDEETFKPCLDFEISQRDSVHITTAQGEPSGVACDDEV